MTNKTKATKIEQPVFPDPPSIELAVTASRMQPIKTTAGASRVSEMLGCLAILKVEIGEVFDPIVDETHETKTAATKAWQTAKTKRAQFLNPVSGAERKLRAFASDWITAEQRRIRIEQAEAQRKQREANEAEEARLKAELMEQGVEEEQAEDIAAAAPVAAPPPVKEPPKFAGMTTVKRWVGSVVDVKLACQSIVNGDARPELVTFSQFMLNQMAGTHRNTKKIPGLKFEEKTDPRSR